MHFGRKDLFLVPNKDNRIIDSNSSADGTDGFTPDVVLKTYIEDDISCTDVLAGSDKPKLNPYFPCQDREESEDSVDRIDESESNLESLVAETVFGIVTSGPFAGPFVVEIVRYTGPHKRAKYFWNGHSMPRRDLYLCGTWLSEKRVAKIWHALHVEGGVQFNNSTVPCTLIDLTDGMGKPMSKDEIFQAYKGEPTSRFIWSMLSEAEKALLSHSPS